MTTREGFIKTADDVRAWLRVDVLPLLGLGFHPDTAAADYVSSDDGSPAFEEDEAKVFDARRNEAFGVAGADIYAITIEEFERMLGGSS